MSLASGPLQAEIERRERAEQALRASDEQFQHLIGDVQDYAIFLLDPQGHVISWNVGAERIKGYKPEEITGQHFSRFYTPEDAKAGVPERGLQAAKKQGRFEAEGWRVRRDGSRFWASVVITALRDQQGKLRGFLKITRDLTERKQAEERLREANAELEHRVQERTEELARANEKLRAEVVEHGRAEAEIRRLNEHLERLVRERTAQLEEVVQSLQAFSYSVSHDLRAPLRNVQTLAQAMLEDYGDRLDNLGRDYAQRLVASARRMDALIRDLLSYNRLTRAEIALQPVGLTAVVGEALRELDAEVAERGAVVRVEEPLPTVAAHRPTLVQVVKNLLANALKFVEPGVKPRVRIWAEGGGGFVRLWVEDNGIGIAPEHRQRIFRVFERLHGEESYPGTGIGLAIVQKGVERMGGGCGVESQAGQGSRFWVELPEAEGAA